MVISLLSLVISEYLHIYQAVHCTIYLSLPHSQVEASWQTPPPLPPTLCSWGCCKPRRCSCTAHSCHSCSSLELGWSSHVLKRRITMISKILNLTDFTPNLKHGFVNLIFLWSIHPTIPPTHSFVSPYFPCWTSHYKLPPSWPLPPIVHVDDIIAGSQTQ